MRYHGRGLTKADIDNMTYDQLQREVRRVHDQLDAEIQARRQAMRSRS